MKTKSDPIRIGLALCSILCASFAASSANAQSLPAASRPRISLDEYLRQVESQNEGFQRAARAEEAFELRSQEWQLLTSPYFFGQAQTGSDRKETSSPSLMGNETRTQAFALGVGQRTNFGLDAKLSYNFANTEIKGADPSLMANPSFATTGPVAELTYSLWKNGFGREVRSNQEAQEANVLAQKYGEQFTQTQLRAQAEAAYWRLSVARESVTATRESLERAERSRDFMSRQARLELSDRAELLQSEAAVAARKMQSQQALDEEASAARAFNTIRGIESNEVPERLSVINDDLIRSLNLPTRDQARADVRVAEQQARAAKASSRSAGESSKPAVDLFLNAGLNGRDPATATAISESLSTDHPNYAVGLKVNIPLQQGIAARAREGYEIQAESSDLAYRRKAYETEREWTDLNQRLGESRKRLDLARKLEEAQKAKLEAERSRLRRGRTTTYTVIQFEEDFANAQLNRLRIEAEILGIYSQLKTFGGLK